MKIAIITNIPAPYRIPLWVQLNKVSDITVLYTSVNDSFKREWAIDFGKGYKYELFANPKKNVNNEYRVNLELYRHVIKERYDTLVIGGYGNINNIICCIIGRILCKKVVMLWDGGFNEKESIIKRFIKNFFYRYLTDAFCVSGENAKRVLRKYVNDNKKFLDVRFTCDVDYYYQQYLKFRLKKDELKNRLQIDCYKKVILYSGRLDERKGIQDLMMAFKEIQDDEIGLLIVGTGPYEGQLKSLIATHGIKNVVFAGFADIETIPQYYCAADLCVLPTYYDTWGLVINEAMACGLPVISTTAAGVSYDLIKENENGYIIQPGDIMDLALKMKKILYDDSTLKLFSQRSLQIIKNWTINDSVRGFVECFEYLKSGNKTVVERENI